MGALHRLAGVLFFNGIRGAFVKGHGDVGSDAALHVHYRLGRKEVGAAVDVGLEFYPFFADFAPIFKAVHLKTAAVGEHRSVPGRERMKPAGCLEDVDSGAQVQVVGVAQNDVCTGVVGQQVGTHRLYSPLGADRHENRGRHDAMGRVKEAGSCARMGVFGLDFELHRAKVRRGFLDYFCGRDECVVRTGYSVVDESNRLGLVGGVGLGVAHHVGPSGVRVPRNLVPETPY